MTDAVSDEHCFSTGLSSKYTKKWQRKKKRNQLFPTLQRGKMNEKENLVSFCFAFRKGSPITSWGKEKRLSSLNVGAEVLTAITMTNTQQHGCLAVLADHPYVCSWVSVFGRGPGSEALTLVNLHFYYHKT